ncbi:HAD-IA family hydrolase [Metasolibacillus sp. FSL K6-0083]|uniref:HAD family hydrolase n=1 Tax=Metasolibacillus sp. FSL K6-0083 TaxID=2921416 RepID=UPI00315AFF0F
MDILLKNIDLQKYDTISFDIFDTLIYRNCSVPKDIFKLLAQVANKKFQDKFMYTPQMFCELRSSAEQRARKKNKKMNKFEVTLTDIYAELPLEENLKIQLLNLELEIECENIALNEQIYDFIKYCVKENKKIILISDMYLSLEQIKKLLLVANIDLNYFEDIFVSSEYNATKSKGTLYNIVENKMGNLKYLHIGDNYQADVINAKKAGFDALHYGAIPEDFTSIFCMEEYLSKDVANELRTLRKLIGYTEKYNGEQLDIYRLGAQVFGPAYALYCEWVVDFAKKKKIHKIFPLMREGKLFSKLINEICQHEGLDYQVEPIFVSRKATFLPSFSEINEDDIQTIMEKNGLQLENLFNLLGLDINETAFSKLAQNTMKDFAVNDMDLFKRIYSFLISEQTLSEINRNVKQQKAYLLQYIKELSNNKEFITVDFGFNGTIQKNLDKTISELDLQIEHLLFVPSDKVPDNILNGHKIFTWVDIANKQTRKNIQKSTEILEVIINATHGTTINYEQHPTKHNVIPVLDSYEYPEFHKEFQKICWEGILDFQKLWLNSKSRRNNLTALLNKSNAFAVIFERLIRYPLHTEAKLIGKLIQHECFNFTKTMPIISSDDYRWLDELGVDIFLNKTAQAFAPYEVYWPQGVIENRIPEYYTKKFLEESLEDELLLNIYNTLKSLDLSKYHNISIYGAGELGLKVLKISNILKVDIKYFIDRNYLKMEFGFEGVQVKGMEEVKSETDLIIIASIAYLEEIEKYIIGIYVNDKCPDLVKFD